MRRYPETEKKLWNALGRVSWEQETAPVQNLHFKYLSLSAESRGIEFSEEKFGALRMLDVNGKFNNLAYLLSDENPHVVKFAVYRNAMMDFAVKKEFRGSWVTVLEQVLEYANIYNDVSARVIGGDAARTEAKNYPDPSLREAVVNAFAHFDASFPSDIKIEFYPDRVEIGSPGTLYRTTMKDVLGGRQSFRNPNLVYVLNKFNFIENYATGLKKIFAAYRPYPVQPKIGPTDNFFIVTLPNVAAGDKPQNEVLSEAVIAAVNEALNKASNKVPGLPHEPVNEPVNPTDEPVNPVNEPVNPVDEPVNEPVNPADEPVNEPVNPTDEPVKSISAEAQIFEAIKENPHVTIAEIGTKLHVSASTVKRIIKKLKEQGFLARVGPDKTGYYRILKEKE